jgi:peptidoglycan/LPS O-acetylase OafA/YrhL
MRKGFNPSLNGYRAVCALMVLTFHLASSGVIALPISGPIGVAVTTVLQSFAYGVEMFFMISGFVILGSVLRHPRVSGFLQDRVVRIFTAWVPALLVIVVIASITHADIYGHTGGWQVPLIVIANLLLLPPLVPVPALHYASWSLTYEWIFYLTAAASVALLRHFQNRTWAVAFAVVSGCLLVVLRPCAMFFLTGVLVFVAQDWFSAHRRWLKFPIVSLLVFLLAWRFTEVAYPAGGATLLAWLTDERSVAAAIAFIASVHLFASVCLNASSESQFLQSRLMQFLGTISYSFYLWHVIVIAAVKRLVAVKLVPLYGSSAGFVVLCVVSLGVTIPVAWMSWRLFEVRLAGLLRRGSRGSRSMPATAEAA